MAGYGQNPYGIAPYGDPLTFKPLVVYGQSKNESTGSSTSTKATSGSSSQTVTSGSSTKEP